MQDPETRHGEPDHREAYGVDGHDGPAEEREGPAVDPTTSSHKDHGEGQGHGQEKELGRQLILEQALGELAPEAQARGAQVYQEEQRVQAPAEERRPLALQEDARQRVEGQQGHDHERRVHVGEHQVDRVEARHPGERRLDQEPPVDPGARDADVLPEVGLLRGEHGPAQELPDP